VQSRRYQGDCSFHRCGRDRVAGRDVVTVLGTSKSGRELGGATTRRIKRSCLGRVHVATPVTTTCKDPVGVVDVVLCRERSSVSRRRQDKWCRIGDSWGYLETGETQKPGGCTAQRGWSSRVKEERAAVISRESCSSCRAEVLAGMERSSSGLEACQPELSPCLTCLSMSMSTNLLISYRPTKHNHKPSKGLGADMQFSLSYLIQCSEM
jgi:hypothetical protein